jgi:hypothetical protein
MITSRDDFLGHQTSEEFSKVAVSDTKHAMYTERFWYMGAIVPDGKTVFGLGLGYYPNRQVMDCYAAVTVESIQYNFRASRAIDSDPLHTSVGPLEIDIASGLEEHRLMVRPNESGLLFDLRFFGRMHPNDEGRETIEHKGRVVSDVRRFIQAGSFEGHIEIPGRRIEVAAKSCVGFRDRSWGLRVEARTDESTPPVSNFPPILYVFLCAQFEAHNVHLFFKESAPGEFRFLSGDQTGRLDGDWLSRKVVKDVKHDLIWRSDAMSQEIEGGRFEITFDDGSSKRIEMRSLGGQLFLKGGLYGGLNGWFQGDNRGRLHTGHNRWNLTDPGDRLITRTLAEQVVEVRDGDSLGFGTIQCGVGAGYPGYKEIQHHPAQ